MIELKIEGMSCGHCEMAVRKALAAVPGVTQVVKVDRHGQCAQVEGDAEADALLKAVQVEGYRASLT